MYVTLIGDIVRTIPIFEKCSEPFIRHLCCQAHYSHFCSDEFVTRIGDVDENLYIIKRGEVCTFIVAKSRALGVCFSPISAFVPLRG